MYNTSMRQVRQDAIRDALKTSTVATQQELLHKLKDRGIRVDQSTLSRDLAELEARKSGRGYVLPKTRKPGPTRVDYSAAVLSFQPCGPHLIVVRTAVGQAAPVALVIDAAGDASVVATLAGDDTIFVATKNRRTQTVALRRLETWFGDKRVR